MKRSSTAPKGPKGRDAACRVSDCRRTSDCAGLTGWSQQRFNRRGRRGTPRLYQSCLPFPASFSKAGLWDDSLSFCAFVTLAGFEILELLDAAVRPLDYDPVGLVFPAKAESERQFGLRKIA